MEKYGLGIDDFKALRTTLTAKGIPPIYCDKSLFIKDVFDEGAEVLLIMRPRRFGKTLNLSMLKYFCGTTEPLFDNLKIAKHPHIMKNFRGFPTIFISLKEIKCKTVEEFREAFRILIRDIYYEFRYLKESTVLDDATKTLLATYDKTTISDPELVGSLHFLMNALFQHHGKKVVCLLDEYDTPLQYAYLENYLSDIILFFRNFMTKTFKGNTFLAKAVITGIARVAKENIFSGFNNPGVYDIRRSKFAEYFGFTDEDLTELTDSKHKELLKKWYNGYIFGDNLTVYNPWSILSFLDNNDTFQPYWINSSDNDIVKESLRAEHMADIQKLIEGGHIMLDYAPHLIFDDLKNNSCAFWNLLFTSGYLTADPTAPKVETPFMFAVKIPNMEVKYFFEAIVKSWFGRANGEVFLRDFLEALLEGDVETVQDLLSDMVAKTLSIHDVTRKKQEAFYHGFLLGITLGLKETYIVKSNRESGFGFYDIALFPKDPLKNPGVVIEVKLGKDIQAGLLQVVKKQYHHDLELQGCRKILTNGFTFSGKNATALLA